MNHSTHQESWVTEPTGINKHLWGLFLLNCANVKCWAQKYQHKWEKRKYWKYFQYTCFQINAQRLCVCLVINKKITRCLKKKTNIVCNLFWTHLWHFFFFFWHSISYPWYLPCVPYSSQVMCVVILPNEEVENKLKLRMTLWKMPTYKRHQKFYQDYKN